MRQSATLIPILAMAGALALAPPTSTGLSAQQGSPFRVAASGERARDVQTARDRGFAAVSVEVLTSLGWTVEVDGPRWRLRLAGAPDLLLTDGVPFLRFGEAHVQLADAPYVRGATLYLPAQLLWDVLPFRLSDRYALEEGLTLRALAGTERAAAAPAAPEPVRPPRAATGAGSSKRVVIIDPGHGGDDPGALGPGGTREKDVALALGVALARELERHPELEVHLTRRSDLLVPLWERGQRATEIKGDRPGVFISLHANALPAQRGVRGFETYFLSEARTDDERRVAANENAPLAVPQGQAPAADPDLDFILRELRNLDHQHWSALLAELVQARLGTVHPGPDRGVKQGPFAVITNALMPAVLVEVGFITNREEEGLLTQPEFHEKAAKALADATLAFFMRYPSGRPLGSAGGGG
jgi:N-acetylmuramoyl-L-alanine amidase